MKSRVHPKYKTKYRVRNWASYERALIGRGNITIWLSPAAIAAWKPEGTRTRGAPPKYSDLAIDTALTLRLLFHLPLRQAEGFLTLLITNVGVASLTVGTKEQPEAAADAPIEFIWRGDGQPDFVTRPKISAQGLQFDNAPSAVKAVMFPANFSLDPEETSKRLSDIRRKNQLSFLLDTLQTVFPDVTDVSVENNAGVWMVYVSTKQITSQMIPMALHSAGMNRFVAILLGIASVPRGVVLIDELENGLYYKTLPDVWRAIHTFAQQYKTQVFATTHSMECLSAVRDVVHTAHDDFSLIRATSENGERWLDLFSGDKLDGALESGFELR